MKSDITYYPTPFQVIYLSELNHKPTYRKGIAFHEWVVDAENGAYFKTKGIVRLARKHGVDEDYAIIESFDWVPIQLK